MDNINVTVKSKNPAVEPKSLKELTTEVAEVKGTIGDIYESVEQSEQDVERLNEAYNNSDDFIIGPDNKMKRKPKAYAPAEYSGLGEIYLDKNMKFLGREFEEFVSNPNVPHPGESIGDPDGIVYDRVRQAFLGYRNIEGSRMYTDTWDEQEDYTAASGYKYLCTSTDTAYKWQNGDLVETAAINGNVLTQAMLDFEHTIYHIQYDYDLNGRTIEVPEGCVLQFEGGSLRNGTLVGDNTKIEAGLIKIFDTNIVISGSWQVTETYPEWFGAKEDDSSFDNAPIMKKAIEFANLIGTDVSCKAGKYHFLTPIIIDLYTIISIYGVNQKRSKTGLGDYSGTVFYIHGDSFIKGNAVLPQTIIIQGTIKDITFLSENVYANSIFEAITCRQFVFESCRVNKFSSFVHGRISNVSKIHKCEFSYCKHLVDYDYSADSAIVDSDITDNYINGSVPYSYGETVMITGSITHTSILNNFIDYFRYIFKREDASHVSISTATIISGNIFDYCYSFVKHNPVQCFTFTNNIIKMCSWDYAKGATGSYWDTYGDESIKNTVWVFINSYSLSDCVICDNVFQWGDFFIIVGYNKRISNTVISNNRLFNSVDLLYINKPTNDSIGNKIDGYKWGDDLMNNKPYGNVRWSSYVSYNEGSIVSAIFPWNNSNGGGKTKFYPICFTRDYVGNLFLSAYMDSATNFRKWIQTNPEDGSNVVDTYTDDNSNVVYMKNKSTNRVSSCLNSDLFTLQIAELISVGDIIYLYDVGVYVKRTANNYNLNGFTFDKNFVVNNYGTVVYLAGTAPVSPFINQTYRNTNTNKVLRYNGIEWADATLIFYPYPCAGSIRPPKHLANGQTPFFDTSLATPRPIWNNGTNWVDATGATV